MLTIDYMWSVTYGNSIWMKNNTDFSHWKNLEDANCGRVHFMYNYNYRSWSDGLAEHIHSINHYSVQSSSSESILTGFSFPFFCYIYGNCRWKELFPIAAVSHTAAVFEPLAEESQSAKFIPSQEAWFKWDYICKLS